MPERLSRSTRRGGALAHPFVGVICVRLVVPGARAIRGARRPVRSLMDRLSARGALVVREVSSSERPVRFTIVGTTCGNSRAIVQSALDVARNRALASVDLCVQDVQLDVFRWDPSDSVQQRAGDSYKWDLDE